MDALLYALAGYLVGVLAPVYTRLIVRPYEKQGLIAGLKAELIAFRIQIASDTYKIKVREGEFDRKFVAFILPVFQGYQGMYPVEEMRDTLLQLSLTSDSELAEGIAELRAGRLKTALSLKRYRLPYLESNMGKLDLLPQGLRYRALELASKLEQLNEVVDETRYFLRLTFDSSLTPERLAIAEEHVKRGNITVCNLAQVLIQGINDIEKVADEEWSWQKRILDLRKGRRGQVLT